MDPFTGLMCLKPCHLEQDVAIIFTSDSAKACKRAFRGMAGEPDHAHVKFLMCLCLMHQLCLAINAAHKVHQQVGVVFCATALLHRAAIFCALQGRVEAILKKRLRITLVPPSERDRAYQNAIVQLLLFESNWACDESGKPREHSADLLHGIALFRTAVPKLECLE